MRNALMITARSNCKHHGRDSKGQTLMGAPEIIMLSVVLVPLLYLLANTVIIIYTKWYLALAASAAAEAASNYHSTWGPNSGQMQADANNAALRVLKAGFITSGITVDPPVQLGAPSAPGTPPNGIAKSYQHLWSATVHVRSFILPGLQGIVGTAPLLKDTAVALEKPILIAAGARSGAWGGHIVWLPVSMTPPSSQPLQYGMLSLTQQYSQQYWNGCTQGGGCTVPQGCPKPSCGFVTPNPNKVD
jgi:hypothetical protein